MENLTETEKAIIDVLTRRLAPDDAVIKVAAMDGFWWLVGYGDDGSPGGSAELTKDEFELCSRVFPVEQPRISYSITRAQLTAIKRQWKVNKILV